MGQLTTHVLDISVGLPAAGVKIDLYQWNADEPALITSVTTGKDGRVGAPLLAGESFRAGRYALTFHTGAYFRGRGVALPEPAFMDEALIRLGIANPAEHYHVPLLIAPWSYSVYRGG